MKRSLTLDPEFENGFSRGWHFVLPEAFKQELDIRTTERVENKKKVLRWTQGPFYCFSEGQVIYDTEKAYLLWSEALHYIHRYCNILSGTPNTIDENKNFVYGQVFFEIKRPNDKKTGVEKIGTYRLTQTDFVEFLKTGLLNEKKLLQI